jgi:hypothetical protein
VRLIDLIRESDFEPLGFEDAPGDVREIVWHDDALVCVDINNVRDWATRKSFARPGQLCPIARLPFERLWMEYEEPTGKVGLLFMFGGSHSITGFLFEQSGRESGSTTFYSGHLQAQSAEDWRLSIVSYVGPVDEIGDGHKGACFPAWAVPSRPDWDYLEAGCLEFFLPGLAALSFFHCSNVSVRQIRPSRQVRRYAARKAIRPPATFSFIEIHRDARPAQNAEPWDEAARGAYRPHIVRGHFKIRKTGLFWWKPFRRGGETGSAREYRVWGPQRGHERRCVVQPNH